jgi:hypothetical protein
MRVRKELPASEKSPHSEVGYVPYSKNRNERCARCRHFIAAVRPRCETVASPIADFGWCERFEMKRNA